MGPGYSASAADSTDRLVIAGTPSAADLANKPPTFDLGDAFDVLGFAAARRPFGVFVLPVPIAGPAWNILQQLNFWGLSIGLAGDCNGEEFVNLVDYGN
ncbi:hypothetical protein NG895_02755 [Aeoliella sp. ICT_H6.2]|uniref:Uncharacterized protein n=1 Tax=Aeoliella straminimaris TaxID=2954799 RepID=A0A9X2F717_9BACT|nr:hypothetical protein [Aeoliella straminimaris]MCO6042818.1 hypothetical protein [Aeoliella straminimaris]